MGPGEFPRALVLGPLGRERQWRFSLLAGAGAQLGWRSDPVNSLLTRGQKPGGQCPHGPHTKDLLEEDKGAAVLSMNPGARGGDGTSDPLEGGILFLQTWRWRPEEHPWWGSLKTTPNRSSLS